MITMKLCASENVIKSQLQKRHLTDKKWHLAYKYEVFNLQSCISEYKIASRLAIQPNIVSMHK